MSNVECYYCGEKSNIHAMYTQMRKDLKKSKYKKENDNSQTNVVSTLDDDDVFLTMNKEAAKSGWMIDFTASMHICQDRVMFDALKTKGEFGHLKMENNQNMKVEDIGSVRMNAYNGAIHNFHNVMFVLSFSFNVISLGEMTSQEYKFVGSK